MVTPRKCRLFAMTKCVYCPASEAACKALSGFLAEGLDRLGIGQWAILKHRRLQSRALFGIGLPQLVTHRLHEGLRSLFHLWVLGTQILF